MNPTSKTLLSALIISLFSLATLQGYRVITQTGSETQVLGDTTIATKAIPCDVINNWQKTYCTNVGPTAPVYPTSTPSYHPTPTPAKYPTPTPAPTGIGVTGFQMTRSCNSNGTFNFTVSGNLNPPPSHVDGIHFLVMNNTNGKFYHQGYSASANLPVHVAVTSLGYLMDGLTGATEITNPLNSYTIRFVNAAFETKVDWNSQFISSYFITPSAPCPVIGPSTTPTRAPTPTPKIYPIIPPTSNTQ